jgi:hypothetical protein|tara:strand:+ start:1896 stop:2345 length:450 start_codon:yes stop_codon:yes gene_type:complete
MTPMDKAWLILKRQTTLGEFHPDFPSPYGDHIMYYHGTTAPRAQQMLSDKLHANRGVHGTGAYVTSDYDKAKKYADRRAYSDKKPHLWNEGMQELDESAPMVLGIRERAFDDLGKPTTVMGTDDWMEEGYFPQGIPPQYLTRLPENYNW